MPVMVYIRVEEKERELPPLHDHEIRPDLAFLHRLYDTFDLQPTTYAVVLNLHQPQADMIVLSEHGMGVIELKDKKGKLTGQLNGPWLIEFEGNKQIIGETRNPHEQVQAYATKLRTRLLDFGSKNNFWKDWSRSDLDKSFRVQTVVCFTSVLAVIDDFRQPLLTPATLDIAKWKRELGIREWEDFEILRLDEMIEWTYRLNFRVEHPRIKDGQTVFERLFLDREHIQHFATNALGLAESKELSLLLCNDKVYGYLTLQSGILKGARYPLKESTIVIGRESADLRLTDDYARASRVHARLIRILDRVYIEDLDSDCHTYVNGERLLAGEQRLLHNQDEILLGGAVASEKTAWFVFSTTVSPAQGTEPSTGNSLAS